jgi:hypothetical protein
MECKLQVFKQETDSNSSRTYRFAIIDLSRSESYPTNFVCMLPVKVCLGKKKIGNVFEELFGDKSVDFAIELLNDALKSERDIDVRLEIERRLKLIDPKQVKLIRCSGCKKMFQPRRIRKYRQNFCKDCLKAKYGLRQQ